MSHTQPHSAEELRRLAEDTGVTPLSAALEVIVGSGRSLHWRRFVSIEDCGEALEEIPEDVIPRVSPHPYQSANAPYGEHSPYFARRSVVERLKSAQDMLSRLRPGFKIQLFDAYRPIEVQAYMVNYEMERLAREDGVEPAGLDETGKKKYFNQVYTIWAKPTDDPKTPPPHSTGSAVDVQILEADGKTLDMGSNIDGIGSSAFPNYFRNAPDVRMRKCHDNRELLLSVMSAQGFRRLPYEWWHFSYGDQMWALLEWLDDPSKERKAKYGRLN